MDSKYVNETISKCPQCGGKVYDWCGHLRCDPCDETWNLSEFYVPIIERLLVCLVRTSDAPTQEGGS